MHLRLHFYILQFHYLRDYAKKLELNIHYSTEIKEIDRSPEGLFKLKDQNDTLYYCTVLIVR